MADAEDVETKKLLKEKVTPINLLPWIESILYQGFFCGGPLLLLVKKEQVRFVL